MDSHNFPRVFRKTRVLLKLAAAILVGAVTSPAADETVEDDCIFQSGRLPKHLTSMARVLARAYPDQRLVELDDAVLWPDGTVMPLGPVVTKRFSDALRSPALIDQLSVPYPQGAAVTDPVLPNCDPGRIRFEPFFRKMYGCTPLEVVRNLEPVQWLSGDHGETAWVSRINGVNVKLAAVSHEIDTLPWEVKRYAVGLGGSFYWRNVRGTSRLSAHSFGIAVDLDPRLSSYWRWDKKRNGQLEYQNNIPMEIVAAFERNGFIWGGRWYHYDTMHFEYRPELLVNILLV